ncbi:phage major capsid protein [uncultured Veillonella sp.]|jgi:HK97 family phage major capsid protein|uniref:phage major capsid protein n=1 Tax=uncultured Veillonella sp. TaxID=159268 RepID=UPI0025E6AB19|nr:phage major capsid protein [uncultured Veillonella sp.]
MNEKERELRQKMAAKNEEIRGLMNEGKLDDAEQATEELRRLKRELQVEITLGENSVDTVPPEARQHQNHDNDIDVNQIMARALRGNQLSKEENEVLVRASTLNEGTGKDGGFIVPKDVQTAINELKRTLNPLDELVRVEKVATMSGERTYEKLSTMTAFPNVAELANIANLETPEFNRVEYKVQKYAGILPISSELLADTDQNLLNYLYRWLAKKDTITRNTEIAKLINTLTKKPITGIDGLKDILNVDLDPAIALTSIILTNQDGYNYLDKLKDTQGHYLLQPNPLNPTEKMLSGKVVKVVSNKVLPTDTSGSSKNAPVIIGDLTESITLFDREAITLLGTNIGGNAFVTDGYNIRGTLRFDTKIVDNEAAVFGQLKLA